MLVCTVAGGVDMRVDNLPPRYSLECGVHRTFRMTKATGEERTEYAYPVMMSVYQHSFRGVDRADAVRYFQRTELAVHEVIVCAFVRDLLSQKRALYTVHQTSRRTQMPFFYSSLDMSLVRACCLSNFYVLVCRLYLTPYARCTSVRAGQLLHSAPVLLQVGSLGPAGISNAANR